MLVSIPCRNLTGLGANLCIDVCIYYVFLYVLDVPSSFRISRTRVFYKKAV